MVLRRPPGVAEAHDRRGGFPARRDPTARCALRRNEAGVLPRQGAPRGHGRERRPGSTLLPELPALLRPAVPLGQGPGAGAPVRRGLQRLDGRGVVWGERGASHSALPGAALGRRAGRRRGPPERRTRRAGGGLQRTSDIPRAAEPVLAHLGSVLGCLRGDRDGCLHAHRLGHEDAPGVAGRTRRRGRHHSLRQQCRQPGRPAVLGHPRTASRG